MKNNKYYAFITFRHNGVTIKAGEIFDANEVKFSKVDIDFLRSQQKITGSQGIQGASGSTTINSLIFAQTY